MKDNKEYILSINPCTYGLNYHDPSIAILEDGKIVAAIEEERLNGIKGSKGIFPAKAINECLKLAKIELENIDKIAVPYEPNLWKERFKLEVSKILSTSKNNKCIVDTSIILDEIEKSNIVNRYDFFSSQEKVKNLIKSKVGISNVDIEFYDHHLSHMASAYYASGFKTSVGVVVDGIGEVSTTTIWKIVDGKFEKILDIKYPNSLGYFYALATAFLGFKPWEQEGKLMALAPYGKRNEELLEKMESIITFKNGIYDVSNFINTNSSGFLMVDIDKSINSIENILNIPSRKRDGEILEIHKDFAWAVQYLLEKAVIQLVNWGIERTGIKDVCVAGGIFMNCKMNMVVRENSKADNYFVQPLAGDLGLVIGSGLLASSIKDLTFNSLSFGPSFADEDIKKELDSYNLNYKKSDNIEQDVAELLSKGNIICWFQGRMEMGARALGNRSILADPRGPKVSDIINERVKHREVWRPFACSMLDDYADSILVNKKDKSYPFMIEAFKVKDEWIEKIPAVIHKADGTTRPQTVKKDVYPRYYNMINNFYKLTGCPLVLNTSFNDKGQPIVMPPKLAIEFFIKNDVDILAIENYIVYKNKGV